jgi:CRP-like cAMP-binding protein
MEAKRFGRPGLVVAHPGGSFLQQSALQNRILKLLPDDAFAEIAADMEPIELPRAHVFSEPLKDSEYSYFIETGIGSIVAVSPAGQQSEVGIFGREGMTPAYLVLETTATPYSIFMQVPGAGHRIANEKLFAAIQRSSPLRRLLLRYAYVLSIQTAYTGLSNSIHHVDVRLARWLLMCHDRTRSDQFSLTHEFLAVMLSVRRSSVTNALHMLEGNHLIYSERSLITIRDRKALEEFAGDAYGIPESEYNRLIGPI